jgi:hypothetical protein
MPPTQPNKPDRGDLLHEAGAAVAPPESPASAPASSSLRLSANDLPKTGVRYAFTMPLFGPAFFRFAGRGFGVAATLLLLASVALVWFGWSWFGLAAQFFAAFFVGEAIAAQFDQQIRSES